MITIRIHDDKSFQGGQDAFYAFTDSEEKEYISGIFNFWYEQLGKGDDGCEYRIVWTISDKEAYREGNKDCCDWSHPDEILNLDTKQPLRNTCKIINDDNEYIATPKI